MKKISLRASSLYHTVLLLFLSSVGFSKDYIVTIDFSGKTVTSNGIENIKKGDTYQIKVININTYLYDVNIYGNDSTTASALAFPSFTSLGLDAVLKAITGLSPTGGASAPHVAPPTRDTGFVNLSYSFSSAAPPAFDKVYDGLQDSISHYYFMRLLRLKNEIDELNLLAQMQVFHAQLTNDIPCPSDDDCNLCEIFEKIALYRSESLSLEKQFLATSVRVDSAVKAVNDFLQKSTDAEKKNLQPTKEAFDKLAAAYAAYKASLLEAKETISAKNTALILAPLVAIQNNEAWTYISFPKKYDGGKGIVKVVIVPYSKDARLQGFRTEIRFPKYQDHFAGVSSGMYYSGLHDSAYSITSPSDSTYKLVRENSGSYEIGLNAMLTYGGRIHTKSDSWFNRSNVFWQGNFGLGLAVSSKVSPRLMIGTGPAFGDKNKFILNAGWNVGYVNRLSDAFSINNTYSSKPEGFMVSRLNGNWFFSAGYIFTL